MASNASLELMWGVETKEHTSFKGCAVVLLIKQSTSKTDSAF